MRRLFRLQNLLIAAILVIASIPIQLRATSSPQFCKSCHEMTPMVASFETSTHAAMGCMGCHTTPGQINFVKDKIRDGTKDVYHHYFGYKTPIRAEVPNQRCLICHGSITNRNVFRLLEVDHNKHLALGIPCVKCHLRVGHQTFTLASASVVRPVVTSFEQTHRKVTLDTCLSSGCHDNKVAKASCATCHREQQRIKPKSHRPGFLLDHGRLAEADPKDCLSCHKAEPALVTSREGATDQDSPDGGTGTPALHATLDSGNGARTPQGLSIPRREPASSPVFLDGPASAQADAWPEAPQPRSSLPRRRASRAPGGGSSFVLLAAMASPVPAKPAGGGTARTGPSRLALRQLLGAPFCASCHTRKNPHPPGFAKTHGPAALANKPACITCHTNRQRDCDSCHKLPMPHPAGFRDNHTALARAQGQDCLKCHDQQRDCQGCHRSEKPKWHTADFVRTHKQRVAATGQDQCLYCHQKRECEGCHETTPPLSHTASFVKTHGSLVRKGTESCLTCHKQTDCDGCHHMTRPASHTPNFRQIHGPIALKKKQDCMMCHRQSTCNACHQLPMPHPAKYAMNHTADAKRNSSACANCHKKADCLKCHDPGDVSIPAAWHSRQKPDDSQAILYSIAN